MGRIDKTRQNVMQDKEILDEFNMMSLTTLIRNGVSLDKILSRFVFREVFELVKTISIDIQYGLNSDTHNNADRLYAEILERFPIEEFPEKYI